MNCKMGIWLNRSNVDLVESVICKGRKGQVWLILSLSANLIKNYLITFSLFMHEACTNAALSKKWI